ncbi:hypothetical protein IVB36_19300 [Bradyrhizobium sp. 35]|nr:hypothetical protein [Bradyrhizobium sp. 35]MCK1452983.1 hypothetical protein [Bradyrhizobium sp. 35]
MNDMMSEMMGWGGLTFALVVVVLVLTPATLSNLQGTLSMHGPVLAGCH